jgi:hypothetical protein
MIKICKKCGIEKNILFFHKEKRMKDGYRHECKECRKKYKRKLGQFYTKNSSYITTGLLDIFNKDDIVIDPFCGEWDLLKLIKNKKEGYDIDPKNKETLLRDSLLNPINFEGKAIITNPPFLAKNKNRDKNIYNLFNVDDLYEASLLSIIGCEKGIIILPLNFFSSNRNKIRKIFLSNYKIIRLNIFEEKVFDDTSYTICSFSFVKEKNIEQKLNCFFFPSGENKTFEIKEKDGFLIGAEIFNLQKSTVKIKRLLIGGVSNSNLFLSAIDTGSKEGKINLSIKDYYYGKNTDRAFATIVFDKDFSLGEQIIISEKFNNKLNYYRKKYNSLFLTNYRNSTSYMARKRIGFDLAYNLISNIILEEFENGI